jgi:HEAT repeat protein
MARTDRILLAGAALGLLSLLGVADAEAPGAAQVTLPVEIARLEPAEQCVWLLRSIREPDPPLQDPAPLLAESGRSVVPGLLEILDARRVPAFGEKPPQVMSIYQRKLLHDALWTMGRDAVFPSLGRFRAERRDPAGRRTTIEVLGVLGGVTELDDILRIAQQVLEGEDVPARFEETLRQALADVLRRVPEAHAATRSAWRAWSPMILPIVLFAVGEARDPAGLDLLADVMSWEPELAELCLAQVRLVGPSRLPDVNGRVVGVASELLDVDKPSLCRASALALGELGATEAIPQLIRLLDEDSYGLSDNAHWALQRITGMRFHNHPSIWSVWYRDEVRWYEREARSVFERLDSPLIHDVAAAVRELSRRTFHREEIARELATVLTHPNPTLRARACGGLARLEAVGVVPQLIAALADRDAVVAEAAHSALIVLTEQDLGRDPEAWRELM